MKSKYNKNTFINEIVKIVNIFLWFSFEQQYNFLWVFICVCTEVYICYVYCINFLIDFCCFYNFFSSSCFIYVLHFRFWFFVLFFNICKYTCVGTFLSILVLHLYIFYACVCFVGGGGVLWVLFMFYKNSIGLCFIILTLGFAS